MSATTDKKLTVYEGQEPFKLIEASKLNAKDDFIQDVELFGKVRIFREKFLNVLNGTNNIHDFYIQGIDPCESEDGNIEYHAGKMPAVGHSFNWARKVAYEYAPYLGSRVGTEVEYLLFCGVLIKELVEKGIYSVNEAWHNVCANSVKIGNYNTVKPKLLPTGSMKVGRFADLANTCKWLYNDGQIYTGSGAYCHRSDCASVAEIYRFYVPDMEDKESVPWVVIPV